MSGLVRARGNAGGRREKPEERERKDFGTVFHADVTYWTIDSSRGGFWRLATMCLILKPNVSFRHSVSVSYRMQKKKGQEPTGK